MSSRDLGPGEHSARSRDQEEARSSAGLCRAQSTWRPAASDGRASFVLVETQAYWLEPWHGIFGTSLAHHLVLRYVHR